LRDPVRRGGGRKTPLPRDVAKHLERLELHLKDPTIQPANVKKKSDHFYL
jgi:hypothetical protein